MSPLSESSEASPSRVREAVQAIYKHRASARNRDKVVTSDLSIDEALVLHSIGWEPVELVAGAGVFSIQRGSWTWAVGEVQAASYAVGAAMEAATRRVEQDCRQAGGHGVVGMSVEVTIERHHATVVLVGTAVAPSSGKAAHGSPFVSDLSGRDFALLHNAGWEPRGLAYGVSFVHVPRRSAGTAMKQSSQNVELVNFTEAMYSARESAMERMQSGATALGATGVVAVNVAEGPMEFASHTIGFTAWGTAVCPGPDGHKALHPQVVVSLNDRVVAFEAAALRE